ncbi:hypothetical protein [Haladaptatus halobius]|uniref:hypothetical protein n=1 Tax=Haladaptatus halobius TaxID=2884875 RepID=UPI001D0BDED0|nr:hypothetical protein [Haladaptatus halobius]
MTLVERKRREITKTSKAERETAVWIREWEPFGRSGNRDECDVRRGGCGAALPGRDCGVWF